MLVVSLARKTEFDPQTKAYRFILLRVSFYPNRTTSSNLLYKEPYIEELNFPKDLASYMIAVRSRSTNPKYYSMADKFKAW